MNAFANPEDALPYEYPEFPAPERPNLEVEIPAGTSASGFVDYQQALEQPAEENVTVVQTAIFQDFREVLPAPQA